MKRNIACPCGRNFQVETPEEISIDDNPRELEKILDGSFFTFPCPECGKKHKPEYKIMLTWKAKNLKLEVLPELDRGEFYRRKKAKVDFETVIGYPEMADRITVIKDDLEPIVIETLKYYLLMKAEENYPEKNINAWYHSKGLQGIEFHLDGIKQDEVAVIIVPENVYDKTFADWKKHPKKEMFTSLRSRSYLSVQNIFIADVLK